MEKETTKVKSKEKVKVPVIENGVLKLTSDVDKLVSVNSKTDKTVPLKITSEFLENKPLSYSSLKKFRESPSHYIEYLTAEKVSVDAFVLGHAVECLVFEPDKFKEKFEVYTPFPKRKKEDKERWIEILEQANENKITLIDNDMVIQAKLMAESVKNTPETAYYLDKIVDTQVKLYWKDKKTDLPIIGYVDAVAEIENQLILIDFKTSISSNPDDFYKSAAQFEYDLQVGSYLTGYHKIHYLFPEFMFMVVEKTAPYNSTMFHCPGKYIEDAKHEFQETLVAFKHCMDTDQFSRGYHFWDAGIGYFDLEKPRWKKSKFLND